MKNVRFQSAMEYLMTYGWAILIIAVVLGALFGLGFFNSANLAPKVAAGACQVYRPQGPGTTSFINLEGTCNNELPQYVAKFNGNAEILTGPQWSLDVQDYTISFWAKFDQEYTSYWSGIFDNVNSGSDRSPGVWQTMSGSGACLYIHSNPGDIGTTCTGPNGENSFFNIGQLYNVIITNDNGIGTVYVNGKRAETFAVADPMTQSGPDALYIGASEAYQGFNGLLADIQFYNASLSANEVTALYDEGIGGVPMSLNSLVGWWPLNGNANDYSGNLNNGVSTNTVFTSSWAGSYTAP